MTPASRWGRWQLEESYLVYHPDAGAPDPGYEILISRLDSRRRVQEQLGLLRGRSWLQPDDLASLEQACEDLMNFELVDESRLEPPPPMSWEEYRKHTESAWSTFLASADPNSEPEFQAFFERYPNLLPGPYGRHAVRRHGSVLGGVISQPELPGPSLKRPDFLLFDANSAEFFAILIEIEAPGKPWCNDDGTPNYKLTKAHSQLREWKLWFEEPSNILSFRELYNIRPEHVRSLRFVPQYVLIYGRAEEANRFDSFARMRSHLQGDNEFLMTYDRLAAYDGDDLTLRLDRSGPDNAFRVINVPPTFTLNRKNAALFSRMKDREKAIQDCSPMSDERKRFLLDRIGFADDYVRRARSKRI
jgi:hypothetical protein